MEVIKIDIKKTVMDLVNPEKVYKERILVGLPTDDLLAPSAMMYEEVNYQVEEVVDSEGKSKYFMVQVDDRKMFLDLVNISNAEVDIRIQKALEERERDVYIEKKHVVYTVEMLTEYNTILKIKKLPWYKRLFNNF